MKIIRLIIIIYFLQLNVLKSQEIRTVKIVETYTINQFGDIEKCEIYIPIIEDYNKRQKVKSIDFSKRPQYKIKIDDTRYAVFEFSKFELRMTPFIEIKTELDLYDYDLLIAQNKTLNSKLKKNKRRKYLKTRGLYKLNETVFKRILMKTSLYKIFFVNQIHDYVTNHLEYSTFFGKDKGALYAFNTKKGDCTEYADLMISICRYSNIPARRVSGLTVKQDKMSVLSQIFRSSGHAWVEVYFDEFGWVPFDPTHSDGSRITNFFNLETKYIYVSFSEKAKGMMWKILGTGKLQIDTDRKVSFLGLSKIDQSLK